MTMLWRVDLTKQYERYQREIDDAITRVLQSGRYILADEVASFEAEYAEYIGVQHAVSVASGTDALILALRALGVGSGDEVVTSPFTAIPTVSAIMATGATPVFTDVDPGSFLMDLDGLPAALSDRTRAVIPVHVFGNMVDVAALRSLLPDGVAIIEDACQAHGSTMRGKRSGAEGDLGAFSFYPTKNLGGYGDGGMITTNSSEHAQRLKLLRMYGMTDKDHTVIPGYNSRLDELQAAVLRVKLQYLDAMNQGRRRIAAEYERRLDAGAFRHQRITEGSESNYHVFVTRFGGDRDALVAHLDEKGIQTNIYYPVPLHLQESTRCLGYEEGSLPNVEQLCREVIALTMYAELQDEELDQVITAINSYVQEGGPW
jgi:dTDP-4-amino-4,6-dideoxygalactose transaminase